MSLLSSIRNFLGEGNVISQLIKSDKDEEENKKSVSEFVGPVKPEESLFTRISNSVSSALDTPVSAKTNKIFDYVDALKGGLGAGMETQGNRVAKMLGGQTTDLLTTQAENRAKEMAVKQKQDPESFLSIAGAQRIGKFIS